MFQKILDLFSNQEAFKEYLDAVNTDPINTDPINADPINTDPINTDPVNDTQPQVIPREPNKLLILLNQFFNKDNLNMLVTFLGIFIVLYLVLGIYFRIFGMTSQESLISSINIIFLLLVAVTGLSNYYQLDDNKKNNLLGHLYSSFKNNLKDVKITFSLIVMIGFISGLKKLLRLPSQDGNSSFILDTSNLILWITLLLNITVICFTDLLNIPVFTIIEYAINSTLYGENVKDINNITETTTIASKPITPQPAEEVFNVSNNIYTSEDAPDVCSALGARLASYDEVEDAYNKGADWCSYGWSENQMGLFPTQKDTWQKLQSNNGMKNSCGRPGVNGGYIPNPKMRLGVNCYGIKPQASDTDMKRMATSKIVPRTSKDIVKERKISFWKENADKMLNLNPHSKGDWSVY